MKKSGGTKGVCRKTGGGKVWQGLGNSLMCVGNYGLTLLLGYYVQSGLWWLQIPSEEQGGAEYGTPFVLLRQV